MYVKYEFEVKKNYDYIIIRLNKTTLQGTMALIIPMICVSRMRFGADFGDAIKTLQIRLD